MAPSLGGAWPEREGGGERSDDEGENASTRGVSERIAAAIDETERIRGAFELLGVSGPNHAQHHLRRPLLQILRQVHVVPEDGGGGFFRGAPRCETRGYHRGSGTVS